MPSLITYSAAISSSSSVAESPRFKQHRQLRPPGALQQGIVLHIPGADLDHVGVLLDQLQRFVVQRLGHNAQPEALPHLGHDAQSGLAHALEGIWGGARLVRPAAQELRSRPGYLLGYRKSLLPALNRAWSGDHGNVLAADRGIRAREADHRILFLHIAADQFVGLGDLDYFGYAGQLRERVLLHRTLVSRDADRRPLRPGHGVRPVSERFDPLTNGLNLLGRRLRLHNYEHGWSLVLSGQHPVYRGVLSPVNTRKGG